MGALVIFTVQNDFFSKHICPFRWRGGWRDEIIELKCCRRQNDKWRFHRFLLLLLLLLIGKNMIETPEISHSVSVSQAECRGFESLLPLWNTAHPRVFNHPPYSPATRVITRYPQHQMQYLCINQDCNLLSSLTVICLQYWVSCSFQSPDVHTIVPQDGLGFVFGP